MKRTAAIITSLVFLAVIFSSCSSSSQIEKIEKIVGLTAPSTTESNTVVPSSTDTPNVSNTINESSIASPTTSDPSTQENVAGTTASTADNKHQLTTKSKPVKSNSALAKQPAKTTNIKSSSVKYIVLKGDTFYKICKKFYTNSNKYSLLIKQNNIKDTSRIDAGETLIIPEPDKQ